MRRLFILLVVALTCAGCAITASYDAETGYLTPVTQDPSADPRHQRARGVRQYNLCDQFRNDFVERERLGCPPSYQ